MSKGGKGGSQPAGQTTVKQGPWSEQQPYLKQGMEEAKKLFETNFPEYYPGATYAPKNQDIDAGIGGIRWAAQNDVLSRATADQNRNIVGGNYLYANPANGLFSSLSTMGSPEAKAFAPFMTGARLDRTDPALQSYISGERLGKGNPYTQELTDSVLAKVLPGIQSQFIKGGTLSSPDAARASSSGAMSALAPLLFAQQQEEERNQIMANDYQHKYQQQEVQNQMTAGDTLGKLRLAAGAGTSNSFQSGMDQMLRGIGVAPSSQQVSYRPSEQLWAYGQKDQAEEQKGISDAMARWEFEQKQPYERLNQYLQQIGASGSGSSTSTPYFQNPMANALGTIAGVGGAANSLFGSGGLFGSSSSGGGGGGNSGVLENWSSPSGGDWGGGGDSSSGGGGFGSVLGGIGSAIGGIGSLFGLFSDRRTKDDIKPVGALDNGLRVYSYRYRDDPEDMRRIGLMADEVEEVNPDAVHTAGPVFGHLAGMKMVDYAKAVE